MPRSVTASSPLDPAQVALNATKRHWDERKERKIDKVLESFQSPEASAVKAAAVQVYSALKSQIGAFVQSSEGLTRALDEIGKIHPFIQVAVIPFKAALALELKRVDNDKKVLALFVQMNDMMSNLRLLETIKPDELGKEGIPIADRFSQRLKETASVIQDCSHVTHDYYKSKFIVKLLKSNSWEDKFTDFASNFVNQANDFSSILGLYTGIGVQSIHRITERLDGKLDILMKLVFETLVSPEEQELSQFVEAKGGADKFADDDELLQELIRKRDAQVSRTAGPRKPGPSVTTGSGISGKNGFIEIKDQLKSSLDKSLAESKAFFNQKFEEQKNQISEVKTVVRRESDRVIYEILSGPKDRIMDKAMFAMWVEMGWKGSAKSRHVVLAIRDFYSDQLLHVSPDTKGLELVPPTPVTPTTPITDRHFEEKHSKTRGLLAELPALTDDDIWAIGCINNARLRPLQEALDPDCSDFVTIHELNEFSSSRPRDWSLPLWLAYWTSGFEVTIRQYTSRIRAVLYDISIVYGSLVIGNAGAYSRLVNSYSVMNVDLLVGAVHTIPSEDLEEEYPHPKFREYAADVEGRIEKRLKQFGYFIDERNTLSLVVGTGRLEEHTLPLLYLILRRIRSIVNQGKTRILTDFDFRKPLASLDTLWTAICERSEFLKQIFKLRNVALKEELRRYCYALYYFVPVGNDDLDAATSYYNRPDATYDSSISDLNNENEEVHEEAPQAPPDTDNDDPDIKEDEDDIESALEISSKLLTPNVTVDQSPGLVGVWHGFYYYGFYSQVTDGLMGFRIDSINEDNSFIGGGSDSLAGFTIKGNLDGHKISFLKEYDRLIQGIRTSWFYSGTINDSLDAITGKWGRPRLAHTENARHETNGGDLDDGEKDPSESAEEDGFLGTFAVQKKSAEFVRFRPSDEEFEENKPRALWKFALDATADLISRRGVLTWSTLKKRRDNRLRFIALFSEYQDQGLRSRKDYEEFQSLQKQLSAVDLRFYRHLAQVFRSRTVQFQTYCDRCLKYPIVMTRYMCLTCSEGHYYETVDICTDCVDKEFTVLRNNGGQKLNHVPSVHSLLQIRRPFTLRDHYRARESAKTTKEYSPDAAQEASGIICHVCKERISERPYWSCCECSGVFVCEPCNLKIEKNQPWLYEVNKTQAPDTPESANEEHDSDSESDSAHSSPSPNSETSSERPELEDLHNWSHDLVLITKLESSKRSLSVEERLTNLEERFEKQNKVMEGIQDSVGETRKQLERLEIMLQQFMNPKFQKNFWN